MIALIRIKGLVAVNTKVEETLSRLRLRRKYACVIMMNPGKEKLGMIKRVKDYIAYGEINEETFEKLLEARGKMIDKSKKIDVKKIITELKKGKSYEEANIKPFFRLHPPRKGIDSKKHFGVDKGVLGNNKEKINDLILRML
jgi:large subunit ribosomal protein L30